MLQYSITKGVSTSRQPGTPPPTTPHGISNLLSARVILDQKAGDQWIKLTTFLTLKRRVKYQGGLERANIARSLTPSRNRQLGPRLCGSVSPNRGSLDSQVIADLKQFGVVCNFVLSRLEAPSWTHHFETKTKYKRFP